MYLTSDAEKGRLKALLISAILRLGRILLLRECVTLKDEKIEKPLTVAVIGAGVIIGTKIKRLQRATYLERNANIRQCRTGSLRLPDEIDF